MPLLIGTQAGIAGLDGAPRAMASIDVHGLAPSSHGGWWLVGDEDGRSAVLEVGRELSAVGTTAGPRLNCVEEAERTVWVGGTEARLFRLEGEALIEDEAFMAAPGRESWYTPWGGPPDVRSISANGTLYVNVHVGGILRRDGDGWSQTIEVDADVHQVEAVPGRSDWVLAATARGLALSRDRGTTWDFHREGLHAAYCRAVTVAGGQLFLSASLGPGGRQAGVYRSSLDRISFERCRNGLPEWFSSNVDTACLAADDASVYLADPGGTVYRSGDEGRSWEAVTTGLPPIRALAAA